MGKAGWVFWLADERERVAVVGRVLGPGRAAEEAGKGNGYGQAKQSHDRQNELHLSGKWLAEARLRATAEGAKRPAEPSMAGYPAK